MTEARGLREDAILPRMDDRETQVQAARDASAALLRAGLFPGASADGTPAA